MAKQENVTLAGKPFTIIALPPRKADIWREKVRGKLAQLNGVTGDKVAVTADKTEAASKMFDNIFDLACAAPNEIRDLLFEYAPEIAKQKEFILDNGDDEELIDAFVVCAKMAFPFGKLISLVRNGFNTPQISTN